VKSLGWCAAALASLVVAMQGTAGAQPAPEAAAAARRVRLLHTNDLQSRLLGFAPNRDATPRPVGDDATIGGIGRLATVVRGLRSRDPGATLLVDAGDFMMGTLFQTLAERSAPELRLMHRIGYDAVSIGNHEFDFGPGALAATVRAAQRADAAPPLLLANARWDPAAPEDDDLAALAAEGAVRPRLLLDRGGVKVGVFGLMGTHAASVSRRAAPVTFEEPAAAARREVEALRAAGAELVVCLSHGGLRLLDGEWVGEDRDLAREAPGIDVIVSAHTHVAIPAPVREGRTLLVQAGSEGRFVGALDLELVGGEVRLVDYALHAVDDSSLGAPDVLEVVDAARAELDAGVLVDAGLRFDEPVFETTFDLAKDPADPARGNLGWVVADAMRDGFEDATGERPQLGLAIAGTIRDAVRAGRTGIQQTSDLFRVLPLGRGRFEDTPGYPLARFWITGRELKNLFEMFLVAHRVQGPTYYPFFSGVRFHVNQRRLPLDQVYRIEVEGPDGDYREIDPWSDALYSIVMDSYFLEFLHVPGEYSLGLFSLVPKDARGVPFPEPRDAVADADPERPGVQEVKVWRALLRALRRHPDTNGNGVPDLPEALGEPPQRVFVVSSWSLGPLLDNTSRVTGLALGIPLLVLGVPGGLYVRRRRRRRAASSPAP
jgi:5'-nucleotidase